MKKIILTFGLIGGAILSATMIATMPFHDQIGFDKGALIGYTSMVLAFLLVFFGVRSYRDNVSGGSIRFGRAFVVGLGIAAVASLCYVATWEVIYFNFMPDFMVKYNARVLEQARSAGMSEEALAQKKGELDKMAKLYENPAINVAMTFAEPMPVGLVIALVTAGVLSRKRREENGALAGATV